MAVECRKMIFPRISFKPQLHLLPFKVVCMGLNCACCRVARSITVAEVLLAVLISQGLTADKLRLITYRGYARDVINHVTPTLPLL